MLIMFDTAAYIQLQWFYLQPLLLNVVGFTKSVSQNFLRPVF